MEEELEKTKQSYQTQISAHEKKAHNNWVSDPEINDGSAGWIDVTHKLQLKYVVFIMNFAYTSVTSSQFLLILQSVLICSSIMSLMMG